MSVGIVPALRNSRTIHFVGGTSRIVGDGRHISFSRGVTVTHTVLGGTKVWM